MMTNDTNGASNVKSTNVSSIIRTEDEDMEIKQGEHEKVISLKVKADPENIDPEERKRKVKKLAGAISHSLRANGEINVRAFGRDSIGKAAKALAIARRYVAVQNLRLECSPGFITAKIGENELTGICFYTFAVENGKDVDMTKCESILRVSRDPENVTDEDRKNNLKKLAGAIFHSLEDHKEVVLRCFGNATVGKAAKAMAVARGYVGSHGGDLYCWPDFIVADMNGSERTGISFYVYSNQMG